jgi:RimJ/RimL family protein N-acetyltransferase
VTESIPSEIRTDRLLIRAPRIGDGPELNAAICESLDSLSPWMPWARSAPSLAETEERVIAKVADFEGRTDFAFYSFRLDTGALAAVIGLHPLNDAVPSFMIGYWCRSVEQGQGLTTEAVRAVTSFAFEHLHARRVELCCDPRNTGSRRVAAKAGFTLEGELRNESVRPDGVIRNTLVFSRIPGDRDERAA